MHKLCSESFHSLPSNLSLHPSSPAACVTEEQCVLGSSRPKQLRTSNKLVVATHWQYSLVKALNKIQTEVMHSPAHHQLAAKLPLRTHPAPLPCLRRRTTMASSRSQSDVVPCSVRHIPLVCTKRFCEAINCSCVRGVAVRNTSTRCCYLSPSARSFQPSDNAKGCPCTRDHTSMRIMNINVLMSLHVHKCS